MRAPVPRAAQLLAPLLLLGAVQATYGGGKYVPADGSNANVAVDVSLPADGEKGNPVYVNLDGNYYQPNDPAAAQAASNSQHPSLAQSSTILGSSSSSQTQTQTQTATSTIKVNAICPTSIGLPVAAAGGSPSAGGSPDVIYLPSASIKVNATVHGQPATTTSTYVQSSPVIAVVPNTDNAQPAAGQAYDKSSSTESSSVPLASTTPPVPAAPAGPPAAKQDAPSADSCACHCLCAAGAFGAMAPSQMMPTAIAEPSGQQATPSKSSSTSSSSAAGPSGMANGTFAVAGEKNVPAGAEFDSTNSPTPATDISKDSSPPPASPEGNKDKTAEPNKPAEEGKPEYKPAEEPKKEDKPAEEPPKEEKPAEEPKKEEKPAEEPKKEDQPKGEDKKDEKPPKEDIKDDAALLAGGPPKPSPAALAQEQKADPTPPADPNAPKNEMTFRLVGRAARARS
ncbi:MAG: hypothetical protein M1833_002631 [Piccolia ochrophora]|nr:MAG: hypothetical protein M1833_002631 [Piccolia ochrophora]